jgi:cytoskeletal protein CcmA (bactofilin family)
MFGNGDKSKSARNSGGGVETLIGPRVLIRGDVHFSGGLYVEGTVQGAVIADENCPDAVVTLADKGVIEGEVRAPHVIVNGELRGDVYATGHIELSAKARVQGNIYYQVVQMAAGAMISGRLIHGESPPKQLPKPEVVKDLQEVAA